MFDRLNKTKKLEKAKELFIEAVDSDKNYQEEARDDFDFRNGNQWKDTERIALENDARPVLTFNLIKSSIDLLIGMSTDNRKRFRCSPVEKNDEFLCEVLNDILEWLYDSNDYEREETSALESAAISGRGYLAVDFVPDPRRFGDIKLSLVDVPVHEVHFDPASRRHNLEDASYICWDKWLSRTDFKVRYPKVPDRKIDALIEHGPELIGSGGVSMTNNGGITDIPVDVVSDDSDYDKPVDYEFYNKNKDMIRVVHMEYWDTFKRYFGFNPETKEFEEFDGKNLKQIKAEFLAEYGEEFTFEILMDKKVKWIQFVGDDILYDDDSPLPYPGFSICLMTAYRDPSGRTADHFGVVRLMKDPQKEVNKRWSQTLNMLNQQVQAGVFAEADAFVDDAQAESSMKEAGSVTYLTAGAISGGKFKERVVPRFPNAPMQLEQYSQDIIKKITGINPDLLGQDSGRQEPGVVVRLRQQQGLTLLKPLFNNFNAMKKEIFKRVLTIVMQFMPDQQILRIIGQNDRYEIDKENGIIMDKQNELEAPIRNIRDFEYNINADSASSTMTQKMFELTALLEMQQKDFPVDPLIIIEKMELPITDKLRWIEYIQSQQEGQAKAQEEEKVAEIEFKDREIAADETKNQMDFVTDMLKIKQMADKDDKKQTTDFAKLDQQSQQMLANFISQMASTLAQSQKGEEKKNEPKKGTSKDKKGK